MAFDPRAHAARFAVTWRTVGVSRRQPTGLMCGAPSRRGAVFMAYTLEMTSRPPIYGRSASGTVTVPSSFW